MLLRVRILNGLQAPLPFKRACICQIMTGVQVLQAVLLLCICDSSNTLSGQLGQDHNCCNSHQIDLDFSTDAPILACALETLAAGFQSYMEPCVCSRACSNRKSLLD